jgi:nicotinamidase-related amidase
MLGADKFLRAEAKNSLLFLDAFTRNGFHVAWLPSFSPFSASSLRNQITTPVSRYNKILSRRPASMHRAFGLTIRQTLEDVCDPSSLALIVYDMQVGIVHQISNGPEITAQVVRVLEAARSAGIRVFFTRHMSLPKELMGAFQFRTAMAWQRVQSPQEVKPWFTRDDPGFQLVPEMAPRRSEAILDKITMSAFEGTPLNIALRDCGISAFAIVGIAMEIGIEPTARHGADLGYIPVVVKDACGFGHRDAAERSIASLDFAGDSLLTTVDIFCAQLGKKAA